MKYLYVGIMMLFAFVMTYVMLRLMIESGDDFFATQSLFDQAAFMACLMGVVELAMMNLLGMHPPMSYREKQQDFLWIGILTALSVFFAYRIRYQKGTTSKDDFYREMTSHHAMAVKMIREVQGRAFAQDLDFQKFLHRMLTTQEREIQYMKDQINP